MKIILTTYLSNNAKKKLLPIIKQIKRKYENKPIFIQFVSKNKLKTYSYKNNYKQISNGDFEFEQNDLTIFLFSHRNVERNNILFKKYSQNKTISAACRMNIISVKNYLNTGQDEASLLKKTVTNNMFKHITINIKVYLIYLVFIIRSFFIRNDHNQSNKFKNILLVKFDVFGDMVVALPYLEHVKKCYPDARISLLASKKGSIFLKAYENLTHSTLFHDIMEWDAPWHYRRVTLLGIKNFFEIIRQIYILRKKKYDLIIQYREHGVAVWFALMITNGRVYSIIEKKLPLSRLLYKHVWKSIDISIDNGWHMVDFPKMIVKGLGGGKNLNNNYLSKLPFSYKRNEPFYNNWLKNPQKIIINIGAGMPVRMWGVSNFSKLIDEINQRLSLNPLLLCGDGELVYYTDISSKCRSKTIGFPGTLSMEELISVVGDSDIVITSDTGVMHLAAAFNKKIIAIYGAGELSFCYPLSNHAVILQNELGCSGCGDDCFQTHLPPPCLSQITVNQVFSSLISIMDL